MDELNVKTHGGNDMKLAFVDSELGVLEVEDVIHHSSLPNSVQGVAGSQWI